MLPLTLNASAPNGTLVVPLVVIIELLLVVVSDNPCEPNTLDVFNCTDGILWIVALPFAVTDSTTGDEKATVGFPISNGVPVLPMLPNPAFNVIVCASRLDTLPF